MANKQSAVAARAGIIGVIAGLAAGGLMHSLLPPVSVWTRAAISGGAAAVTGAMVAWLVFFLLLRKP